MRKAKVFVNDMEAGRLDTLRKILSVLNIRVQLSSPLMDKITGNEKS